VNEKAGPLVAVAPKTNKQTNEQKRMLVSHVKSTRYSSHILINFNFFWQSFEKPTNTIFQRNPSREKRVVSSRTNWYDEANSRYS